MEHNSAIPFVIVALTVYFLTNIIGCWLKRKYHVEEYEKKREGMVKQVNKLARKDMIK